MNLRWLRELGLNKREQSVVLLLAATFVVGSAITVVRRQQASHAAAAIALVRPAEKDTVLAAAQPAGPLNLNTADARQLEALPGIGPVLAARIIEWRDAHGGFRSVKELRKVSGIGEKRYAALKDLVTVSAPADTTH